MVSRGLSEVLLAPLVRVYLSEVVSKFGAEIAHWSISTQVRLPAAVGDRGAPAQASGVRGLY